MKDKLENYNLLEKKTINILKTLLLSVLIGFLFYNFGFNYGGISAFILVCILSGGFILINGIKTKNYIGIFFMGISILLSICYGIYTNSLFRFLNKVLIPITLLSSFLLITYNNIEFRYRVFRKILIGRLFIAIPNIKNIYNLFIFFIRKDNKEKSNKKVSGVLNGIIIAIPILLILCILLCGADEVFAHCIGNTISNICIVNVGITLKKILISIVFALFIFGLYCSFSVELKEEYKGSKNKVKFNSTAIITILTLITVLYSVFTKIQISYLYVKKSMPEGFSYSEYARNGFFQLVFIVVVNVISVVLIKKYTKDTSKTENKILLTLYSLITILTFSMDFSALYKIRLYIKAFGFTRLRVLVSIFIIFLGVVLILLFIFIWRNINLFKPIIICGVIMYVGVNFVNIDDFITRNNIEISKYSDGIDSYYLENLSFDSYDSMTKAYKKGRISSEIYENWINNNKKELRHWYQYNYYCNKGNSIKKNFNIK